MMSDLTTWSDEELLAFIYPKDGDDLCADCGMFNADEYGDCDVMCNSLAIIELSRRLTGLRASLEAADTRLLAAAEAVVASPMPLQYEQVAFDAWVSAVSELRAAIEQRKEGRS